MIINVLFYIVGFLTGLLLNEVIIGLYKRIKNRNKKCHIRGYATDPSKEVCMMKPCDNCKYYR